VNADDGGDQHKDSVPVSPPKASGIIKTQADDHPKDGAESSDHPDQDKKKSLKRSWKASGPVAKLTVVFSGIAALSTFVYAIFAGWQLYEIHSGSKDTHELAIAAGKQADAAIDAAKVAERTLGVFETQQRAWVALAGPPQLQPAKNGVIWNLRNFGSSTAFHIATKGELVGEQSGISTAQDRICREIASSEIWELLFPGVPGRPRAAFAAGSSIRYVVGCVKYRDQFSLSRWTRFCYEPDARDPSSFIACLGYNSTDADENSKSRQGPN
jgi:hypothetical protein